MQNGNGSGTPIGARVERVTVARATELLEGNTLNRNVSDRMVDRYARDMLEGLWQLNGEPVIRTPDGQLLDGQHRMWAILKAGEKNPGIAVDMLIVEGISAAVMPTIDTGKARSFGNVLQISGHVNTNVLAATLRWVFWYETYRGRSIDGADPSHSDLEAYLATHPTLPQRVSETCNRQALKKIGSVSMFAWLYYEASLLNPQKAGEWLGLLASGAGMAEDHPVLRFREKLLADKQIKNRRMADTHAAYGVKSWNAFVTGRSVRALVWRENEEFPTFKAGINRDTR